MVRYGERFFTSLGFEPLPADVLGALAVRASRGTATSSATPAPGTSTTTRTCASRCASRSTPRTSSPSITSSGHNFYQRAYREAAVPLPQQRQRRLPRGHRRRRRALRHPGLPRRRSACSTRPPGREGDLEFLMRMALDKVAFLPFGLLVDQWRWKVFSGEVTPADYNAGLVGAAAQVPGRRARGAAHRGGLRPRRQVPRARQRALHALLPRPHPPVPVPPRALPRGRATRARCTSARSTATRRRARSWTAMLEMGASRPWPDALEAMTGERQIDATAILDYFAPLKTWLDEQNKGPDGRLEVADDLDLVLAAALAASPAPRPSPPTRRRRATLRGVERAARAVPRLRQHVLRGHRRLERDPHHLRRRGTSSSTAASPSPPRSSTPASASSGSAPRTCG